MTEQYKNIAQDELAKLEQYRNIYEATHPYPQKKPVKFFKELGFEAGMLVSSALGSIILSAIRTSTIFMLTEALLISTFDKENIIPSQITQGFPLASMIVSLVAFEGMLSAHGFMRGKGSKKIKISPVAMWLCFGVTITAGLSASFGLLGVTAGNPIFQIISWLLAVLTAIGAPVVAYYGSMNLGIVSNQWSKIKNDVEASFLEEIRSWNNSFLGSFSGKRSQKLFGERNQGTNEKNERETNIPKERSQRTNDGNETGERIKQILQETFSKNSQILGTSDIAKILAAENNQDGSTDGYENYKGYIHKVRREWMSSVGVA
jgi:hypothetical protein